jgi:DNA-binding NarL/FixJ family response regulator
MGRKPSDLGSQAFSCLIADDSELVLAALGDMLRGAGINVVGETGDWPEAQRILEEHSPTVMILDLRLGEWSGLQCARIAREVAPETAVILHTSHADSGAIDEALAAGVRAVVFKQASQASLLWTLEEVAAGRTPRDPPASAP